MRSPALAWVRPSRLSAGNAVASVMTAVVFASALVVPAGAGPRDRLERIERRRQDVGRNIAKLDHESESLAATITSLDDDRARQERLVAALELELRRLDARIEKVDAALDRAQAQLVFLLNDLDAISDELADQENIFVERAVSAYKAGPITYAETFLSAESLGDLVNEYAYYESALDSDARLVEEIETLRKATDLRRAQVEAKRDEIAEAKAMLVRDRAAVAEARDRRARAEKRLAGAISAKRRLLAQVRSNRSRLVVVRDQLERDSEAIEQLLAARAEERREQAAAVAAPAPDLAPSPVQTGGRLVWPASGPVTSGFGYRIHPIFGTRLLHTGIDIGAPYGAPVVAADDGVVVVAGAMGGYGNVVVVDHGAGLATTYNHLSSITVSAGASVARGQSVVGAVGCTGYCTGPHLHFEVRVNGSPVDPMPYL